MMSLRSLVRMVVAHARCGLEPDWHAADPKFWWLALNHLLVTNQLETAAFVSERLSHTFPQIASFSRSAQRLATVPPAPDDPDFAHFVEQADQDVQVVCRRGAMAALLAFTGRHGGLGAPISVMHRWFSRLGYHVVYLRDPTERAFHCGIPSLGGDRIETLVALRRLLGTLAVDRVVTYGNSSGGYGALLYGLEMRAGATLVFGAVTETSSPAFRNRLGNRARADRVSDLRPLFQQAASPPRSLIVYGDANADDAVAARHLQGLSGVTLMTVPSCPGHDSVVRAIEQGMMASLLDHLSPA